MDIRNQVQEIDAMLSQGDIVNAVKNFFADNVTTSDYGNVATTNKAQMVEKMEGFAGAIAKVNKINKISSVVDGNISASEFDIHFDMKDGSEILWHEIIKRTWNDQGQVVREEYFNAQ
jgi:hypothetical protein